MFTDMQQLVETMSKMRSFNFQEYFMQRQMMSNSQRNARNDVRLFNDAQQVQQPVFDIQQNIHVNC